MAINNITGPPVEGENFFGREKELKSAWNHIKKGNSLILAAPRRVGKTSFAKKLLHYAENEGWDTLDINLEEVHSEKEFVSLFVERLEEKEWWRKYLSSAGDTLAKMIESIKISYSGAEASISWKSQKHTVYQQLKNLLDHNKPTLILVDELTVLLNDILKGDKTDGIMNAESFLNWLRSIRQKSGTKIRWIFCSSVGIDNFTTRHGITYTFNDVTSFNISAFSEKESKVFLHKLAENDHFELPEEIIQTIVDLIGHCLPYFLQLIYFHYHSSIIIYNKPATKETVIEAYNNLLESKDLNTWYERLRDYETLKDYALLILKILSRNKIGEPRENMQNLIFSKTNDPEKTEEILNDLLYMLKNDGYIDADAASGNYLFRSPLLRDFWNNRYVK